MTCRALMKNGTHICVPYGKNMNYISKAIKKHNLNQIQLSHLLGVTPTSIFRWLHEKEGPSAEYEAMIEYIWRVSAKQLCLIQAEQHEKLSKCFDLSKNKKHKHKKISDALLSDQNVINKTVILKHIFNDIENEKV